MSEPLTIKVTDEKLSGSNEKNTFTLDCLTEEMTVRELIRARIYQEVQDYNQREPEVFQGLIQPEGAEKILNGFKLKKRRQINWEVQYEKALQAFKSNAYFVLVDDKQVEHLDDTFKVAIDTEVTFIKLVLLVGG